MLVDANSGQDHDTSPLAAFLEDRLSQDERREVERHLAQCRDCRETLAAWDLANARPAGQPRFALPDWLGAAAALALAGWIGYQVVSVEHRAVSLPAPTTAEPAQPRSEPAPPPEPTVGPSPPTRSLSIRSRAFEPLTVKRGGEKQLGSKTFRLVAGEWIDSAFDPIAGLPVVEARGSGERRAVVARVPELAPYLQLGDRVTVVLGGTVYRFLP